MEKTKLILFGDPALVAIKEEVVVFDEALKERVDSLFQALKDLKAVGLAAQHIGLKEAFVCIQLDEESPALALINPEITHYSEDKETDMESSVSFPSIGVPVERSVSIRVKYQDLQGKLRTLEPSGLLARVIQHEVDHLNNVLFYQRATKQNQSRILTRLKQLKRYTQKALKKQPS